MRILLDQLLNLQESLPFDLVVDNKKKTILIQWHKTQ